MAVPVTQEPDPIRALHLKAYEELKTKTADRAVWATALAESGGDERKAVSFYIRERAKKLFEENQRTTPKVPIGGPLYLIGALIFLRIATGVAGVPGSIAGPESWFSLPWPYNCAVALEDVAAGGLLVFTFYLAWLFLQRSQSFPRLMVWYVAIEILAAMAGAFLWSMAGDSEMVSENGLRFFSMALLAAFLVPYLLRSMRVRKTFTRDLS